MLNLENLNEDVLLIIFDYCANAELLALSSISRKFENIIEHRIFYKQSLDLVLTGHRGNEEHIKRTLHQLSNSKRLNVCANWCLGIYEESNYFNKRRWSPSLLHLDKENLYVANGGQVKFYKRKLNHYINTKPYNVLGDFKDSEITCFVKKSDKIFYGCASGEVVFANRHNTNLQRADEDEIYSIDFHNRTYVTTSKSGTKIWNEESEFDDILVMLNTTYSFDHETFYHIRLDQSGQRLVGGKFRDSNKKALRLLDLESKLMSFLGSETSAVYQTLWKDENCILTANFDTTTRLFDVRTNCDEIIWSDQFDSSAYSLAYDGLYGVLTGMKYHCRVNLYDIRVKDRALQVYFPSLHGKFPSLTGTPAYSIACDATQLFIATGNNVRIFNFDTNVTKCKDFSFFLKPSQN